MEFALVVPFLLILAFGIISYGFMLTFRQTLSQAATEGARAAAVSLTDTGRTASAEGAVTDAMSTNGVTCSGGKLKKGVTDVGTCVISPPRLHRLERLTGPARHLRHGERSTTTTPAIPPSPTCPVWAC